jgi:hypothetical protein
MSTTGVSFKVEAQTPAADTLEGLARAAEHARLAEAQLGAQMKAVNVATVGHASAVQAAAKGMDAAGYAAGNLRFQMYDVGQSLAMGMNPMMILAQQGPQVAQAFTQASQAGATMGGTIKAALGPLAVALPVVTVAAVGLALAYQGLTADARDNERVMKAAGMGAKFTADMMDDAASSARRLALITAGTTREAIASSDAWADVVAAYKEATKESDALIESNMRILASKGVPDSWEVAIGGVSRGMGDLADAIDRVDGGIAGFAVNTGLFAFLTTAMDGLSTSTEEMKQETYAAIGAQLQQRAAAIIATQAKIEEREATKNQTEAHRKGTTARKEHTLTLQQEREALEKLTMAWIASAAAEMDAERFAPPPVSEWEALANQIDALVPQKTLSDMEKLAELSARVTEALGGGKLSADQAAALQAQIDTTGTAISSATPTGTAGKAGQALSSPLAAAASFHPIAQAVLAGLQSAANMKDGGSVFTEAADLITTALDNLGDFVGSAFEAAAKIVAEAPVSVIRSLPQILSEIARGIPEVIGALVNAVPDVIVALARAIPAMIPELVVLLAQVIVGLGPQIVIALVSAFTDPAFYEAIGEAFVRGIEQAFERFGEIGGDIGQTIGTGTTAGGGFQLFGVPLVPDRPTASSVTIAAGDLWSDFSKTLGFETSPLGRT